MEETIKLKLENSETNQDYLTELALNLDLNSTDIKILRNFISYTKENSITKDYIKKLVSDAYGPDSDDTYENIMRDLLYNDYLEYKSSSETEVYQVTSKFLQLLRETRYPDQILESMDLLSVYERLSKYVDRLQRPPKNKVVDLFTYFEKIINILTKINKDFGITHILEYVIEDNVNTDLDYEFKYTSFLILLTALCDYVVYKKPTIRIAEFNSILGSPDVSKHFLISFNYHTNPLIKQNLLEESKNRESADEFCLTDKAKQIFLFDILELENNFNHKNESDLILPSRIKKKSMFFDIKMSKKISDLYKFFDKSKYDEIIFNLIEQGFKPGFTCLFYGGPGTGKTETVYQIAKETGREIMLVDMSSMRDKWVGKSEKKFKKSLRII